MCVCVYHHGSSLQLSVFFSPQVSLSPPSSTPVLSWLPLLPSFPSFLSDGVSEEEGGPPGLPADTDLSGISTLRVKDVGWVPGWMVRMTEAGTDVWRGCSFLPTPTFIPAVNTLLMMGQPGN